MRETRPVKSLNVLCRLMNRSNIFLCSFDLPMVGHLCNGGSPFSLLLDYIIFNEKTLNYWKANYTVCNKQLIVVINSIRMVVSRCMYIEKLWAKTFFIFSTFCILMLLLYVKKHTCMDFYGKRRIKAWKNLKITIRAWILPLGSNRRRERI